MTSCKYRPVLFLILQAFLLLGECTFATHHLSSIPAVKFEVFTPTGFAVSIADEIGLVLFEFKANVNRMLKYDDIGDLWGQIDHAVDGRWTLKHSDYRLNIGDVIYYEVAVTRRRHILTTRYTSSRYTLSYTVESYDNNEPVISERLTDEAGTSSVESKEDGSCDPSPTRVRGGGTFCSGDIVFEETFDTFREDVWQTEQYIPSHLPEYPFVSYQRLSDDPTVSVVDGNLRIIPKLQQNLPGFNEDFIYNGTLNLFSGCTATAESCVKQSWGADIIPPIVSGRITSKGFAFKYGTVHIRAKLPQGDWIYPEILLEPFMKKYGIQHYGSGVIKIASSRGNRELREGNTDYSNQVLYGGAIMDFQCRDELLLNTISDNGKLWGDDFYVFSLRWTPEEIQLFVDGEVWARILPNATMSANLPATCSQVPFALLAMGSKMAPFDEFFHLTLGLAAGGITEFPDGVLTSGGHRKPWGNQSRKALLHFWQDRGAWLTTWSQPQLLVDIIRVDAL